MRELSFVTLPFNFRIKLKNLFLAVIVDFLFVDFSKTTSVLVTTNARGFSLDFELYSRFQVVKDYEWHIFVLFTILLGSSLASCFRVDYLGSLSSLKGNVLVFMEMFPLFFFLCGNVDYRCSNLVVDVASH